MANPYARVSVKGSLPGGEVWSVNPAFIGNFQDPLFSVENLQAWADSIAAAGGSNFPAALRAAMGNGTTIDSVRVTLYGADGKIQQYADAIFGTPTIGTTSLRLPTTTAVCLSLYSGLAGRSNRGRLYWPASGLTLTAAGRIAQSDVEGLADATVSMLEAFESAVPAEHELVAAVWSTTKGTGISVSQVRVGDVPDSQRRRRDALQEQYAVAPKSTTT